MKVGISRTIINPKLGVDLSGFASEDRKARGIYDDIFTSTIVLEQESKRIVIVCADILGFGNSLSLELKHNIYEKFGISEEEVLFNASHTHSAPHTAENIHPSEGIVNEEYLEFFKAAVLSSIEAALGSMEDMDMYVGKTRCNIGINRRRVINGTYEFAPNEDAIIDNEVIAVKFMKGEETKAILFNFACHPSTIGTDLVTSDFVGVARRTINEAYGNEIMSAFMQGCCGDIRGRSIGDNGYFRQGTFEDIKAFGSELAESVLSITEGKMKKVEPNLASYLAKVPIPLEKVPDKSELEHILHNGDDHQKIWAEIILNDYENIRDHMIFIVQRLDLSDGVSIVAMNGEVCTGYSLKTKSLKENKIIMVAGYSNGCIGYIPTEIMFSEGGYEPDGSTMYYLLPSKYHRSIEKIISKTLNEIIDK